MDTESWYVQPGRHCGEIVIPVNGLKGEHPLTVGLAVLGLVDMARKSQCLNDAYYISNGYDQPRNYRDEDFALIPALQEFYYDDPSIKMAVDELVAEQYKRQCRPQAKAMRKAFNRHDRDRHFIEVGNRDGFKCRYCGATEKLQLDHIVPLARGGNNDDGNFQILCQSCNSHKRDDIRSQD